MKLILMIFIIAFGLNKPPKQEKILVSTDTIARSSFEEMVSIEKTHPSSK